ncbi:MAG TPA: HD domain-containing protein [Pseudonocardiaceae bacterium]|jgi:(p)ppGpp synthase/HD superfamily hydrolase
MPAQLSVDEVRRLACAAHGGQQDKAGRPYTEHLAAVADGVAARGGSDAQIAAAWLHDAVEDGVLSEEQLTGLPVPQATRDIVMAVSKRPGEPPEDYAARILATPGALLVKLADLAHNADPDRLAALDEATRERLTEKYRNMRALLGA